MDLTTPEQSNNVLLDGMENWRTWFLLRDDQGRIAGLFGLFWTGRKPSIESCLYVTAVCHTGGCVLNWVWILGWKKTWGGWSDSCYHWAEGSLPGRCATLQDSQAPFWFMKLLIEVFVLNFASSKPLLQNVKGLSLVKHLLWHWDCALSVFCVLLNVCRAVPCPL